MWYNRHMRRLRRARQLIKAQQQQLLELEVNGFVALTVHSLTQSVTVTVEHSVVMQAADLLREALHSQRRKFKVEARQLLHDWNESEIINARKNSRGTLEE